MTLGGKRVLITGGAGFIGSHLVDRILDDEPERLVVVDNYFLGRESNLASAVARRSDIVICRLDASDLAAMRDVVTHERIEVVFDLAVVPLPTSLEYPMWTIEKNVGIATAFCELTRWGAIETLIHCSSSEAYGSAVYVPMDESHPDEAVTPYAASKSAADQIVMSYVRTFSIDATIVRPFNNYGPRQNPATYAGVIPIVIRRVLRGEPVEIFGDGEQTRDFIFVRDTVDALVRAWEVAASRGQIINIASGKETSVNELVAKLLNVLGRPDHPVVYSDPRPGDVRRHCGDITRASKLLDFSPAPMADEQLAETVDWYLSGN